MSDLIPTIGDVSGSVLRVQQLSIHGDIYYEVEMQLEGQTDQGVRLRLANHLCERPPVVGDSLTLSFLLRQVNGVKFRDADAS